SLPEIETPQMFSAEDMPELKLKDPIVNILEVGATSTGPVFQPDPRLNQEWSLPWTNQAWNMMARMGYCQGWGLGKAHQGLTCFPHQEENHGEGLGYCGSGKMKRPLRWTLHNHFIRPAGETTQVSELQAYPLNPRSIAIEEQKKKEAEEVYDLTKLFSEARLELEPESSVLAELLQELLGYHTMSPANRDESFRAYTQLAAWDSLAPYPPEG